MRHAGVRAPQEFSTYTSESDLVTGATFLIGIVLALGLGAVQRIESQMRGFESQRQHMLGGLEQHLAALSRETVALSQALRTPNSRARWGELTLRRVAELSGMAAYCDFFEQESGNGMRPDRIVKPPGGRTLAVDAKV